MNSDQIKKMYQPQKKESAFTLVELAIVLVIVGLLIGGVVAGQSLIKAAKLHSFVKEYNQYITAFNTFKLKYNGTPGDIRGYTYWSNNADCLNTTASIGYAGTECNGNNDKYINGHYSITYSTPPIYLTIMMENLIFYGGIYIMLD